MEQDAVILPHQTQMFQNKVKCDLVSISAAVSTDSVEASFSAVTPRHNHDLACLFML